MKKVLFAVIGVILAFLGLYASMLIFAFLFAFISAIPLLSWILYWPAGIGAVQIVTLNTCPIVIGAIVAEKVGGKAARYVFGFVCLAFAVIDAVGIGFGYVDLTLVNVGSAALFGITSLFVMFEKRSVLE